MSTPSDMGAPSDRPTVVCVVGSPRPAGNTSYLVDVAIDEFARRGARCEKILLSEYRIMPCEGHDDCADLAACPIDDDTSLVLDKVYSADAVLLASPVYYEDVSGQMKVFIDRNCHNYSHEIWLQARAVGLLAVAESTGLYETIDTLRRYVSFSSNGTLRPFVVTGKAAKMGDIAGDADTIAAVKKMVAAMMAALLVRDDDDTAATRVSEG